MHPNLILINVGTNDCGGNVDVPNTGQRMKGLIDYLYQAIPSTTVILSGLVPSATKDECVLNVNRQYEQLVSDYKRAGRRIEYANMHAFLTLSHILPDGVHPTDEGYRRMASVWWEAFQRVEDMIQPPDNAVKDDSGVGLPGGVLIQDPIPANQCPKIAGTAIGPIQIQRGSGADDGNYVHYAVDRGVVVTIPDGGIEYYYFGQLVNLGGAPRSGATDELIYTQKMPDNTFRYFYRLNNAGTYPVEKTEFISPLGCKGSVSKWPA
jgi:hypothetical protein